MLLRQGCPWCNQASWDGNIVTVTPPSRETLALLAPALIAQQHPAMQLRLEKFPRHPIAKEALSAINPTIFLCFFVENPSGNLDIAVSEGWHYACLAAAFAQDRNLFLLLQNFAQTIATEFNNTKQTPGNYLAGDFQLTQQAMPSPSVGINFQQACNNFIRYKLTNPTRGTMHLDTQYKFYWKQIFTNHNLNGVMRSAEYLSVFPETGWSLYDFHIENEKNFFLALCLPDPIMPSSCWSWLPCYPKPTVITYNYSGWQPVFKPTVVSTQV